MAGSHAAYSEGPEFIPRPTDRVTCLKVFAITCHQSSDRVRFEYTCVSLDCACVSLNCTSRDAR